MLELAAPNFAPGRVCTRPANRLLRKSTASLKPLSASAFCIVFFLAPENLCIAEVSEISIRETIQRLMDAGLQSIPGGGAEISTMKSARRLRA